ncbi:MAG: response regulator transcription factor [Oscillospiraceae bacterium]
MTASRASTPGGDYLPKPFAPDELICRVRAMLRRGGEYRPTVLTFGDVGLDCRTGLLSCAGQSVRLSGREFQVMELFLRTPKVVLSAERILERVWGWDSDAEINVVWVHISNLRKKLKGRLDRDHPRQPGAGLCAGGRR